MPAPAPAFDLQPTLKGRLLDLRPLTPADFDALFEAASDPLIWEQHPESDRHQREIFQRYFDGAIASRGAFAVIERKSGRIIGSTRFCNLDTAAGEVEIGWTFLERALDRVVFVVGECNRRSQKALEKIGARLLRREQRQAPDGSLATHLVFVMTR